MDTNAPFGFRPAYHPTGLDRGIARSIAAAYNSPIYKGSPVIMNTNGTLTIGTGAADLWGIFDGVQWVNAQGKPEFSNYWPGAQTGATDIQAYCWEDALIVYDVQADGPIAATAIGDQADVSSPSTGTTSTGISTATLSSTLAGVGVQAQFRITGLTLVPNNAWGDAYTQVQVQLARSQVVANKVAI